MYLYYFFLDENKKCGDLLQVFTKYWLSMLLISVFFQQRDNALVLLTLRWKQKNTVQSLQVFTKYWLSMLLISSQCPSNRETMHLYYLF